MRALGFEVQKEEIRRIMGELDKDCNGMVEYNVFLTLMSSKMVLSFFGMHLFMFIPMTIPFIKRLKEIRRKKFSKRLNYLMMMKPVRLASRI